MNLTITGDGDAPVITAGNDTGDVGEDAVPLVATGNLDSTDVDVGRRSDLVGGHAPTYGTAAIDPATGEWTYTLDNDADGGAGAGRGRHAHRQLPGDGDRRGRADRHRAR